MAQGIPLPPSKPTVASVATRNMGADDELQETEGNVKAGKAREQARQRSLVDRGDDGE